MLKQKRPILDALREEALNLCGHNIFLDETNQAYWEKQIPLIPIEALKYLIKFFKDFEKSFRIMLEKSFSKDPEGKNWQKFIQFKKSQISKLSQFQSSSDSNTADADLNTALKNFH